MDIFINDFGIENMILKVADITKHAFWRTRL